MYTIHFSDFLKRWDTKILSLTYHPVGICIRGAAIPAPRVRRKGRQGEASTSRTAVSTGTATICIVSIPVAVAVGGVAVAAVGI